LFDLLWKAKVVNYQPYLTKRPQINSKEIQTKQHQVKSFVILTFLWNVH